ncbi:MAG: helix-turn-helix domain-containing protein [Rhodospirillaceae bacterium]|jgi:MerR family mercuric resistance operon transcriptional regulator|nr:helix-turn-helix domain-containing protein [Rhodospirillaceae bacterium]MBT5455568.1 helix-turn-helix domain-containing protein [Rhodospirillaceae bacterium]
MMTAVTIGKLANQTGCKIETIRYYERIGLLPKPSRSAGGHRLYADEDTRRLAFIRRSRELGFALDDVRRLLHYVDDGTYSCAEIKAITVDHLAEVRRKLDDLKRLEQALKDMIATCDGGDIPECPILESLNAGIAVP